MSDVTRANPTRILEEAGKLLGTSLSDIIPPEAQVHLFNAQRELFLAIAVTIEHNASRGARRETTTKDGTAKRARRRRSTPSRVELD